MKKLWNKIKAYCSGWPEGSQERIQERVSDNIKQEVEESKKRKSKATLIGNPKKVKGLNPKKKKKVMHFSKDLLISLPNYS